MGASDNPSESKKNTGGNTFVDGTVTNVIKIAKRAKINGKDDTHTPLHDMAYDASVKVFEFLVSQGADVNAKNKNGETPFHVAARKNENVEVFEFFVSQGADVNVKDEHGMTPLHIAARWNENVEIVKFLVSQGADVNAKNDNGYTPLHEAARYDVSVETIKFLIHKGADVHAQDNDRKTPLDLTQSRDITCSEELRLYLLEQENREEPYMTDERKAKTNPLFGICAD